MNLKGGIIGHKLFLLRQARLDVRSPRPNLAMADRPLLHFTLNVFIMGSGIEGTKIFKFLRNMSPN
jgi:hypothetical protein